MLKHMETMVLGKGGSHHNTRTISPTFINKLFKIGTGIGFFNVEIVTKASIFEKVAES